jgi:hypothetical protein
VTFKAGMLAVSCACTHLFLIGQNVIIVPTIFFTKIYEAVEVILVELKYTPIGN